MTDRVSRGEGPTAGRTKPRRWTRWLRRLVLYPVLGLVVLAVALFGFVVATRYPQGPAQEGVLALTGATVLVGAELTPLADATVLVRDGVIESVGPRGEVAVPAGTQTLELNGATLLPGLIDLHVHLGTPEVDVEQGYGLRTMPRAIIDAMRHAPGARRAMLEHGVTTLRSLGDDHAWVLEVRRLVTDGELEGPRVFAAGPVFTSRGGHPVETIHGGRILDGVVEVPDRPEVARARVRELATTDGGVDLIKVIQERGGPDQPLEPIAPDVLEAIVDEAHAHGLPVIAHWGAPEDLDELLAAGLDGGLEHLQPRGEMLDAWPAERLETLVERGIPVGPTLAVMQAGMAGAHPDVWAAAEARFGELHDAGVPIVVTSDAPMNGLRFGDGLHRELELLVELGLTPTEALRAATSAAAVALRTDEIGVIAPGHAADLLAVGGDPLDDIGALRDVVAVWRDGRLVVDRRED